MGRLSLTESDLWRAIKGPGLTRVETGGTATGVSDVEYTGRRTAGWIELKVAKAPRGDHPYRFGTAFTSQQATWLLTHDRPHLHQRSFLLVGAYDRGRFNHFLLIRAAPAAALLMQGRPRVAGRVVREWDGVAVYTAAQTVYDRIVGGGVGLR